MKMGGMPSPTAPVRVPNKDDPDIAAAARLKAADEFDTRKGRKSTNLAPAAGADYSRTTLG